MSNLLLLEDDISLIDGLHYSLKKNGFYVDIARTVEEAEKQLAQIEKYDLLILDVTLPDGTGFEVCENVRKHNKQIPIIFLTASDEEVNIIRGLDCGGDDYVTKPFKLGELCSRIRALLRRAGVTPQDKASVLKCGDISIDFLSCRVILNNKILELTNAEYRLLCLLVRNANRIVSRDIILNDLWDGTGNFVDDNTLYNQSGSCRKNERIRKYASDWNEQSPTYKNDNRRSRNLRNKRSDLGLYHWTSYALGYLCKSYNKYLGNSMECSVYSPYTHNRYCTVDFSFGS